MSLASPLVCLSCPETGGAICQVELDRDIGQILHSLLVMLSDAAEVVGHGRFLYGGQDDGSLSFLDRIKQTLAHASRLIASCESAGKSVDDALTAVEEIITKFRQAISGLAEAVVDITPALPRRNPLKFSATRARVRCG